MPENEPILVAPKILRLSATNLEAMKTAAAEKKTTLYGADWRGVKVGDKKPLAIQVVSLSPRWKNVSEEAQRLVNPYLGGKVLDQALGKKITRGEIVLSIANAGSGIAVGEQPPLPVLD